MGGSFDDRFDLQRQIGAGAASVVYEAWDRIACQKVAVKVLRANAGAVARRFVREGAILAELDHPAIVRYVAHGTSPEGDTYIVMEWLDGQTLEERLASGPLSVADALGVAGRVVDALTVAHWRGVVHRDLKPSNLFLPAGVPKDAKVLDFGIAWRVWDELRLTETGALIGTPLYMSPEQARGEQRLDERVDIYALGAVLFECLTGQPPFAGANAMAILCKILLEEAPRLGSIVAGVPAELEALVGSMLAKDPTARPRDALAVAAGLAVISGSGSPLELTSVPSAALTEDEQRILCAIFVREGATGPTAAANAVTLTLVPPPREASQQRLVEALAPHGGRVQRLVDGSIVITFRSDIAPTDQAAQVARCALSVRDLLPEARIAICTGRGTMYGRLPIGDVIDRGVELLRDGRPGGIRLDANVAGLVDAHFDIDRDSAGLYLRSERDAGEGARTVLGKVVTCVGREPQLRLLEGIFEDMVGDREAHAMLITAPAGTGKSRLRQELVLRLQQRHKFQLLVGRGEPIRAGSPFGLLAPSVRWSAGIAGTDAPETRRQKLRALAARHLQSEKATRVAEFLGEMAGIHFPADDASAALRAARQDARLMGDHVRAAWLDWLEAECSYQPVLLVLEDVHWSDPPSVQLVDAALRLLREAPLFVLALARPDVTTRFPRLWEERELKTLSLTPLSRKACEKLVGEVLGENASSAVAARVIEQAEGNPLVLEELLRGVVVGKLELPETVIGMMQARLDSLGAEAGRVLRAASIFGQTFTRDGVRSLLGQTGVRSLDDCLQLLVDREVVQRRGGGALEYAFRHALMREASHATLTGGDRVLGHRLAGEWLEAAGETDAMVMAEHFDLGADRARAAEWYARAAEQALQADDLESAIARAERARACGAASETLSRIHLIQAQAHYWRGELAAAEESGNRAIDNAAPGSASWFRAICELTSPTVEQRKLDLVREWAETAFATMPLTPEAAEAQVACISWYGGALTHFDMALADKLLNRAESMLATFPRRDPWVLARLFYAKGLFLAQSDDLVPAIAQLEIALEAAELAGDAWTACGVQGEIGLLWAELGEFERAEKTLRRVLAEAKRRSLAAVEAFTLPDLGNVLTLLGRVDEARNALAHAAELAEQQGSHWSTGLAQVYLSMLAYACGSFVEAEQCALKAAQVRGLMASPGWRAVTLAAMIHALLAQNRIDEALVHAQEADAILKSVRSIKCSESFARIVVAEARLVAGDKEGTRQAVRAAHSRLMQRMSRITDPQVRANFLSRIPANVRTLELARAWGGE